MPTQYGEDSFILAHFYGRTGRFLDIGAGDGLTWSNTEPLLRAGWSGVMVEPALSQLRWLLENHGDNPKVEIVPGYVDPDAAPIWKTFYDGRDFSTVNLGHRNKIATQSKGKQTFRERWAPAISWYVLMNHMYPGPYQFLNIDVEGCNVSVLTGAPLEQFEMVCVEIDPESEYEHMCLVLAEAGLVTQKRIGGNLLAHA